MGPVQIGLRARNSPLIEVDCEIRGSDPLRLVDLRRGLKPCPIDVAAVHGEHA